LKAFPKESVPLIPMAPSSTFTLPPLFPKSSLPKISLTLKIGPRPADAEPYPCCLCVSMSKAGLVPVHNPPVGKSYAVDAANNPKVWMAHELCASIIPETWVDEFDDGRGTSQRMVYGVDAIVKDRWNLVSCLVKSLPSKIDPAPIEMFSMHTSQTQSSWCACAVHEREVPEGVPCNMCSGRPGAWDLVYYRS